MQPGITRTPGAGLTQEIKELGAQTWETVRDNPWAVAKGVVGGIVQASKELVMHPINTIGGWFQNTGEAIGESAATVFDDTSATQLNDLYGQDVGGVQATLLGTRVAVAAVEAVGVGKVAGTVVDAGISSAKIVSNGVRDAWESLLKGKHRTLDITDELIAQLRKNGEPQEVIDALNMARQEGGVAKLDVIGRLPDTVTFSGKSGHSVLDIHPAQWDLSVNDEWVQAAIDLYLPFKLATEINFANLTRKVQQIDGTYRNEPAVYLRELKMLRDAGYVRVGSYLVPPTMRR